MSDQTADDGSIDQCTVMLFGGVVVHNVFWRRSSDKLLWAKDGLCTTRSTGELCAPSIVPAWTPRERSWLKISSFSSAAIIIDGEQHKEMKKATAIHGSVEMTEDRHRVGTRLFAWRRFKTSSKCG